MDMNGNLSIYSEVCSSHNPFPYRVTFTLLFHIEWTDAKRRHLCFYFGLKPDRSTSKAFAYYRMEYVCHIEEIGCW